MFRLAWALSATVAAAVVPVGGTIPMAASLAVLLASLAAARLPVPFFLARSAAVTVPAWLVALPMAALRPSGGWWLLFMATKAWCAVGMMTVLVTTTPFPELLNVLRRWRCPEQLLPLLGFTYRYIFLLADESERLQMAFRSRASFAPAAVRRKALAGISGTLLARSLVRSERVYDAMLARGYEGFHPGFPARWMSLAEAALLALLVAALIGARIFG